MHKIVLHALVTSLVVCVATPAFATTATCFGHVHLGTVQYGLPGVDITGLANLSYTGIAPQNNLRKQAACKQRVSDVSPQASVAVLNGVCALTPDRNGVKVTSVAVLGTKPLGQTFPFGTLKATIKQPLSCPSGWLSNTTNLPGITEGGVCKQETTSHLTFAVPNGTPIGNPNDAVYGFFWNNTLVLYGNAANAGKAVPIGSPVRTCSWQ